MSSAGAKNDVRCPNCGAKLEVEGRVTHAHLTCKCGQRVRYRKPNPSQAMMQEILEATDSTGYIHYGKVKEILESRMREKG